MPDDATTTDERRAALRRSAKITAVVAAAFSVVVAAVMVKQHLDYDAQKMLDSEEIDALKIDLTQKPTDENLKERIRARDLALRAGFKRRVETSATGRYLLLAGLVLLVLSLRLIGKLAETPPTPGRPGNNDIDDAVAAWSRIGAGAVALSFAGLGIGFVGTYASSLDCPVPAPVATAEPASETPAQPEHEPAPAVPAYPSPDEVRANWPRLFGPAGDLVAVHTNAPTTWDGPSGDGILWKSEVPLAGASSPVVWGDAVFLTAADRTKRMVLCFDAKTGAQRWARPVGAIPGGNIVLKKDLWEQYSYAANTGTTDGRRFYAIFANADLVSFDFDGNRQWAKTLGTLDNGYGHASSLCMHENLLIVQVDQNRPEKGESLSRIDALDGATGKVVWSTKRPVTVSWTTPSIARVDDTPQLITLANPFVISYDPATGREIWRYKWLDGSADIAPSPVYAAGRVFVAMDGVAVTAIKADGTGDVTQTHRLWEYDGDVLPSISTPMSDGTRVYVADETGYLGCLDAATGELRWEEEVEFPFMASPVLVGTRVYAVAEELEEDKGVTFVFDAADAYNEVARNVLGEVVRATPAFMDGRIYMRGTKHLFCIGGDAK